MKKYDHERYRFAEQLYCFTDKSIPEIAKLSGLPERSLYRRARDYKWETHRRAAQRSPMILAEEMYRELADLTATINQRPEGQRLPTAHEAELRRKIVYSIAAVKKFPVHAEVVFILQSLLRYNDHFYADRWSGLGLLMDDFLAHRDVYGYASYQPEHNQDMGQVTEQENQRLFFGADEGEAASPYREPGTPFDDDIQRPLSPDHIEEMLRISDEEYRENVEDVIFKFKKTPDSSAGAASGLQP